MLHCGPHSIYIALRGRISFILHYGPPFHLFRSAGPSPSILHCNGCSLYIALQDNYVFRTPRHLFFGIMFCALGILCPVFGERFANKSTGRTNAHRRFDAIGPNCETFSKHDPSNTNNGRGADRSTEANYQVCGSNFGMSHIRSYSFSQRPGLAAVESDGMGRIYCLYVAHVQRRFVVCAID